MSYMTKQAMTRKQQKLMALIEQREPMVIYQLAKEVGRPYRRVYDNIQKFVEKGLVTLERTTVNNRSALKVVSASPLYQRLLMLDSMHEEELGLSPNEKPMRSSLSAVLRRLSSLLGEHGTIIAGICGFLHGIERGHHDIELATDLPMSKALKLLRSDQISASLDEGVVSGMCDGIHFQMVPANQVEVNVQDAVEGVGVRVASEQEFIVGRCMSGGEQDIQDVALMALQNRSLMWFAMQQADRFGCRDMFDVAIKEGTEAGSV